jgi:hypothetical protein
MNDQFFNLCFLSVKIIAIILLIEGISYLWTQKIWKTFILSVLPTEKPKFLTDIYRVFILVFTSFGWSSYQDELASMQEADLLTRRGFEFGVAHGSLSWLWSVYLVGIALIYIVSAGHLAEVNILFLSNAEPPAWLFFITKDSFLSLTFCWLIGYLLSLISGFAWTAIIVSLLSYHFFMISPMGSLCMIIGGIMGVISKKSIRHDYRERRDLFHKFLIMGLSLLAFFQLNQFFSITTAEPNIINRFDVLFLNFLIFIVFETLICGFIFHFRYQSHVARMQKAENLNRPQKSWPKVVKGVRKT